MLCNDVVNNLLKRHKSGFEFTLDRVLNLLQKLDNPHKKLAPVIHIAGTNGKGSTTAFCRALLEATGANVNVHISPHLVNWRERFRINGTLIDEYELAQLIQDVAKIADENVTIFEILTVCAMLLFKETKADFNIFEVGLGGRLDATNVIENLICSIITPISLDHCSILGDNLEKIAIEKAGIIKKNSPVVFGKQQDKVFKILIDKANQNNSSYFSFGSDFNIEIEKNGFKWQDKDTEFHLPLPNLIGEHQIENAATAIKAIKIIKPNITETTLSLGMKNVIWPGRLQLIKKGKIFDKLNNNNLELWLDGAHNEAGALSIAKFLAQQNKDLILICGMLNTKDSSQFFNAFANMPIKCYTTPISHTTNSISANELAKMANNFSNIQAISCNCLNNAIEKTIDLKIQKPTILLIAGSLHLVGEFLELNNSLPN